MTTQPTLDIDWPKLIHQLIDLALRRDDIMDSSAKLGELLTICTAFAEMEPVVRERATTLALQRQEIPGFSLVHRDGHQYVTSEHLLKLALGCPLARLEGLLGVLVKQLGHISEPKYQALCESAGLPPDKEAIKQSGATVFLRRTNIIEK